MRPQCGMMQLNSASLFTGALTLCRHGATRRRSRATLSGFWWYSTRINEHAAADRSGFNAYRLETFGPELNNDDFFENFTASAYDPKEWVDLISDSGAQYFVLTTKHHDGFSLFDAGATTNRTSLHYGPKRDILGELFEAAKTHQPHLKRGTYFSFQSGSTLIGASAASPSSIASPPHHIRASLPETRTLDLKSPTPVACPLEILSTT